MHPPKADKAPEIITPKYLIFVTLIPAACAACGFSPHALNLIPKAVLYNKNVLTANITSTNHVVA